MTVSPSAVSLFPLDLEPGALAVPGVSYQLVPFYNGHALRPFEFQRGQKFCGIGTHIEDARAGWQIDAGSLRLSCDPLSAIGSDANFSVFHSPTGRMLLNYVKGQEFLEIVPFLARAVLRGPPARMNHGLTVFYIDRRCMANLRTMTGREPPPSLENYDDDSPSVRIIYSTPPLAFRSRIAVGRRRAA